MDALMVELGSSVLVEEETVDVSSLLLASEVEEELDVSEADEAVESDVLEESSTVLL